MASTSGARSATLTAIGLVLLALVFGPAVADTTASFNASTANTGSVALASVDAPTGATATITGDDVTVTWTPGAIDDGSPIGHRLRRFSSGMVEADPKDGLDAPTGCTEGATFPNSPNIRTPAGVDEHTDANVGSTSASGSYRCYRIEAEYPAAPATARWSSQIGNAVVLVQIGHAVKTFQLVDGGTPGQLRTGDSFVFTFIQPVDTTTGPVDTAGGATPTSGNDICLQGGNHAIVIGRTEGLLGTNCSATQSNVGARVKNMDFTPSNARSSYGATYAWSDCTAPTACRVLTATLGSVYMGSDTTAVITDPSTDITPSTTSGALLAAANGQALCNASNNGSRTCRPLAIGSL
jgi:hypothetical protein